MLERLVKFRREIMGGAIILIMLCHTNFYFENEMLKSVYYRLIEFCKVGVDVFFFMSGFGLVFSIHNDSNRVNFYKKRFLRVLPTYFTVILLWGAFAITISLEQANGYWWKYSLISFFTNGEMAAWFIAAIIVLYLLFPLIYKPQKLHNHAKVRSNIYIYIFAGCIYFCSMLIALQGNDAVMKSINEAFTVRIPSFLAGILLGDAVKSNAVLRWSSKHVLVLSTVSMILYVINARYNSICERWAERVLFLPVAFCIIWWTVVLLNRVNHSSIFYRTLSLLGGITLEIYLTHEKILLVYNTYIPKCTMGSVIANGSAIIVAVLLSYCISVCMIRCKKHKLER